MKRTAILASVMALLAMYSGAGFSQSYGYGRGYGSSYGDGSDSSEYPYESVNYPGLKAGA